MAQVALSHHDDKIRATCELVDRAAHGLAALQAQDTSSAFALCHLLDGAPSCQGFADAMAFDHMGLLVACKGADADDMLHGLTARRFTLDQRFPSRILVGLLRRAYQRASIQVEVVKVTREGVKLEVFLIEGLTESELASQSRDRAHFAVTPTCSSNMQGVASFCASMACSGLTVVGWGSNDTEVSPGLMGSLYRDPPPFTGGARRMLQVSPRLSGRMMC